MRVVAVAAHQDDAEFGCGALLASLPGSTVACVASDAGVRNAEARAAAEAVGATLLLGDGVDGTITQDRALVSWLDRVTSTADLVLCPDPDDTHPDHRAVAWAALAAGRHRPVSLWTYRTPSTLPSWTPNMWVPVREVDAAAKVDAIRAYESQAHRGYLDSTAVAAALRHYGAMIGVDYAEAYRVVRHVWP